MRPVTLGLVLAAVAVATLVGLYLASRPEGEALLGAPTPPATSGGSTAALVTGIGTGLTSITASIATAIEEAEQAGGTRP